MKLSSDLIRYESAHSGLAFRHSVYCENEDELLIRDLLSLANADSGELRLLLLGVDDSGRERKFPGVARQSLVQLRARVTELLKRAVEPRLNVKVGPAELGAVTIGVVALADCSYTPYLLRAKVGRLLPGTGFVRRGTRALPLLREDLKALFERGKDEIPLAVTVGFSGGSDESEISLPALPLTELPSDLAAARLRTLLEARKETRDMLGRTETRLTRLSHARVYGADSPFEDQSDDSLLDQLARTVEDFKTADDYYRFETRAHKLNLSIRNDSAHDLYDAVLDMSIQRIDGTGLSEGVFRDDGRAMPTDQYPLVSQTSAAITLRCELDLLRAGETTDAFMVPPRMWVLEGAAGRTAVVDYSVTAEGLNEPANGTLLIHFTAPSATG